MTNEALKLLNKIFDSPLGSQFYSQEIKMLFKLIERENTPQTIKVNVGRIIPPNYKNKKAGKS